MLDFNELRELAADVRVFVEIAEDKAEALRAVITAYDVVLAIFPSERAWASTSSRAARSWTRLQNHGPMRATATPAIAVPDLEHAEVLKHLTARPTSGSRLRALSSDVDSGSRADENFFALRNALF